MVCEKEQVDFRKSLAFEYKTLDWYAFLSYLTGEMNGFISLEHLFLDSQRLYPF